MPDVYNKALTTKNVTKGYNLNGMLDTNTHCYPDFNSILGTLNRAVTNNEKDLVKETFPSLLKYQIENGAIPEKVFDDLGYPQDLDSNGNEVIRAKEQCESYQRAKHLSHENEKFRRVAKIQSYNEKQMELRAKDIATIHNHLNLNSACESIIKETIKQLDEESNKKRMKVTITLPNDPKFKKGRKHLKPSFFLIYMEPLRPVQIFIGPNVALMIFSMNQMEKY